MRLTTRLLALLFLFGGSAGPLWAESRGTSLFTFGGRKLFDSAWDRFDPQTSVGFTWAFGSDTWPMNFELGGIGGGSDTGAKTEFGRLGELFFGVQRTWKAQGRLRPYIGGGLSSVRAEIHMDTPTRDQDSDYTSAVYLHGGALWRYTNVTIGVDGRLLTGADVKLFGENFGVSLFEAGFVLGWSYPPEP
jgi:hypothetical protein